MSAVPVGPEVQHFFAPRFLRPRVGCDMPGKGWKSPCNSPTLVL